jgi:molybdopterin converting factor small subunit
MITIRVKYHNVLRKMAARAAETVEVPPGTSVRAVLGQLAERHGAPLRDALFSSGGGIASHLVVFRNRKLLGPDQHDDPLAEGDELMLFPAIAGGSKGGRGWR